LSNPSEEPVTVLATNDEALVAFTQSLLDGAGIRYCIKNQIIKGLIVSAGMWDGSGRIEVQVNPEDVEKAQDLLKDLVVE